MCVQNRTDSFTTGPTARVLPGLDDVAAQADLLCASVQLQTQVDLPLDLLVWVDSGQVDPAVQPWGHTIVTHADALTSQNITSDGKWWKG